MDRFWLLTWTTYGTWLPGDARGFVSNVRAGPGPEVRHNTPGTEYDSNKPGLLRVSRASLRCPSIRLREEQATLVLEQFRATANHRGWALFAAAVMANHAHLVVGVPGDPDPSDLLQDFKSYGSRALNRRWGKPVSGTWWTESGSKRKLPDQSAVFAAVRYVRDQHKPLVVWLDTDTIRATFEPGQATVLLASGGRESPDPASGGRESPDPASGGRESPDSH